MSNARTRLPRRLPTWLAALLLSSAACNVGPDFREPDTRVAESFAGAAAEASRAVASHPTPEPPPEQWWTTFGDPLLNSLVERAVQANPDLLLAAARVREARARRGIASTAGLPMVDVGAAYSRTHTSDNAFDFSPAPGVSLGQTTDLYQVGFDAVWELDVFGGARRTLEAADADLAAGIESRRDVLVSLLAEVARNYLELRAAQGQAAIGRENLSAQSETLDLTRIRFQAGLASDLDVARSEAQVQTTAALIPALESAEQQAMHRLAVLLGQEPNALKAELTPIAPIPPAPPTVPVGLPSDLLRRRPDVRRAERELAAATARIGVATAELFPSFTLTGSAGREAVHAGDLDDNDSRAWTIGPGLRWPLLDWGRIRDAVDVQSAQEEQAFFAYQQVVLTSLREVEDALVGFTKQQQRRDALQAAVTSNRRAVDMANLLYKQGSTDFLSVLQAQRDLYLTEEALVESGQRVSEQMVALYKALGGGWEIETRASEAPPAGEAGERSLDLSGAPSATDAAQPSVAEAQAGR